ncbi:hypothetical protein V5O48_009449 [Marasmius crinis-equi]|uniref:GmrSD restriction endonucleases N-terminal domain-containing protein n=1 Tax=Marasmius crinis-equi TaxID=585013 RepID=A0ABR3FB63_9AGAR
MPNAEDYYDPDLSDDEDDSPHEKEPTKLTSTRATVIQDFTISNPLKVSRNASYSIELLNQQLRNGQIDLSPDYQRDVVWTKDKQSGLIDSVFGNFHVPPVIFSVQMLDNGSQKKTCIDGKQRLTAIQNFMEGKIPLKDRTGEKGFVRHVYYTDNPDVVVGSGRKYLLPDSWRLIFQTKQVVCVEYDDIQYNQERDVFKRVQLGVPLTAAEKLQAVSTPRSDFVRDLRYLFVVKAKLDGSNTSVWDFSRCRDFHVIGLFLYYAATWDFSTITSMSATSTLQHWLSDSRPTKRRNTNQGPQSGIDVDRADVTNTVKKASRLINDPPYNKPFTSFTHNGQLRILSSIEVLGILLLVYMTQLTTPTLDICILSQLCEVMRRKLRDNDGSMKMRSSLFRVLQDFCLKAADNPAEVIRVNSNLVALTSNLKPSGSSESIEPVRAQVSKRKGEWEGSESSDGEFEMVHGSSRKAHGTPQGKSRAHNPRKKKRVLSDNDSDYVDQGEKTASVDTSKRRGRGRPRKDLEAS